MQDTRIRKGDILYTKDHTGYGRLASVRKNKKTAKRRNLIFSGMLAFILAFTIVSGCLITDSFQSFAKSGYHESHDKLYKSITIEKGDTLWNIAERYMTDDYESVEEYISVLKDMNNLHGDKIFFGDKLVVSYKLSSAGTP